jgi:hypothetical protein
MTCIVHRLTAPLCFSSQVVLVDRPPRVDPDVLLPSTPNTPQLEAAFQARAKDKDLPKAKDEEEDASAEGEDYKILSN